MCFFFVFICLCIFVYLDVLLHFSLLQNWAGMTYKVDVSFIQQFLEAAYSLLQLKKSTHKTNTLHFQNMLSSQPELESSLLPVGQNPITLCPYTLRFRQVPGSMLCCVTLLNLHASLTSLHFTSPHFISRSLTHSLTFTCLWVLSEEIPLWAGAGVAPWNVPAQTVVTQQPVHQALVNICGCKERRQGKELQCSTPHKRKSHRANLLPPNSDSEINKMEDLTNVSISLCLNDRVNI